MTRTSLDRACSLLSEVPLVDGHNDLPWTLREQVGYDLARADISTRLSTTHTDLPRLRAGRVGVQFWSVYVPSTLSGDTAISATLEQVDFVHRLTEHYPSQLGLAGTADEAMTIFRSGRIASLIGAEGGHSIGCSLGVLRALHALGVRYLTLTHNDNVPWADSATDSPRVGGLTRFGREVVAEMNRLGVLVDLSHVSPDTMRDALSTTEAPVMFSHSSCRALVEHPRNVPDEVLAQLPENGGVCMVSFVPAFVSNDCAAWEAAFEAATRAAGIGVEDSQERQRAVEQFSAANPPPSATLGQVVEHIEHVREVAGVAHVGIGGDYDGCDALPQGLADVSCYPNLIAALIDRGWSDDECAKVAGGNALRVLAEAESTARELRRQRTPSLATIEDLDSGQG